MTPVAERMSAEARRRVVIDAALHEFATGGLAGTSTEAVARRAGISQPYVFRLFPSKKDLFVAAISAGFDRVAAAFEEAADGLAGKPALEAMGARYTELLRDRDLLLCQLHGRDHGRLRPGLGGRRASERCRRRGAGRVLRRRYAHQRRRGDGPAQARRAVGRGRRALRVPRRPARLIPFFRTRS
jgi:AcrR family transcriptional regulator